MVKSKDAIITFNTASIQQKIYTIRGEQVMLDSDLAELYKIETKQLNRAVKRNSNRFPKEFMIQLNESEWENLRFQIDTSNGTGKSLRYQIGTSETGRGGRRYLPYAFTEQGVAMLSAMLKSETAIKVSIQIINAFVSMRRFISTNAKVFERLDSLQLKQLETDNKIEKVFDAINRKVIQPKQGIFYDGQVFDAHKFVSGLIRNAQKSIILVDNYIDETILDLFSKKNKNVNITIFTNRITKSILLDIKKFNTQYPKVEIKKFNKAHDRFLIIDEIDVYHFGASLKDLGKKWFAFSKFDKAVFNLLENLKKTNFDE